MITIEIGDKEYKVEEAKTEEQRRKGLSDKKNLPEDQGMLFYLDYPQSVDFWMKNTSIPLDIIFINSDKEVISVKKGEPESEELISENNVLYVLEVNQNSGIKKGDEFDIEEDDDDFNKMLVLAPNGDVQMELDGGERIFSRNSTKIMIKKAKKVMASKGNKQKYINACKSLGKYLFKELTAQEKRDPEYVDSPKSKSSN